MKLSTSHYIIIILTFSIKYVIDKLYTMYYDIYKGGTLYSEVRRLEITNKKRNSGILYSAYDR